MDQNNPLVCKSCKSTYVAVFFVAFALGLFAGMYVVKNSINKTDTEMSTIEDPAQMMMVNNKVVNGVVTAISGSNISLNALPVGMAPLSEATKSDLRTVSVDANTKIVLLKQKDMKLFDKEMADFAKKINVPQDGMVTPPEPVERVSISLSEIKAGDFVTVLSNSEIGETKSFVASEVLVQDSALTDTLGLPGAASSASTQ